MNAIITHSQRNTCVRVLPKVEEQIANIEPKLWNAIRTMTRLKSKIRGTSKVDYPTSQAHHAKKVIQHRQSVCEYVCLKHLTKDSFTVVSAGNLDFLHSFSRVLCGNQKASWHGTTVQSCTASTITVLASLRLLARWSSLSLRLLAAQSSLSLRLLAAQSSLSLRLLAAQISLFLRLLASQSSLSLRLLARWSSLSLRLWARPLVYLYPVIMLSFLFISCTPHWKLFI